MALSVVGTDRFTFFAGLTNGCAPWSNVTRQVGFSYCDNVNAGNWTCQFKTTAGTLNQLDSTVAVVAAAWYDLYGICLFQECGHRGSITTNATMRMAAIA